MYLLFASNRRHTRYAHALGPSEVVAILSVIQSDEVHIFRGKEEPAKEVECVLIYNEEDGVSPFLIILQSVRN
jgi:hypothetical protein